jgi:hypothetical protein
MADRRAPTANCEWLCAATDLGLACAANLVIGAADSNFRNNPMAKKSIAERIAQLEAQKKTLQARLAKQDRAQDTRRKVLLGAFLLHRLENDRDFGPTLKEWVRRELPGFLVRPDDKALFSELLTGAAAPSSTTPAAAPAPASSEFSISAIADLTETELLP